MILGSNNANLEAFITRENSNIPGTFLARLSEMSRMDHPPHRQGEIDLH